MSDQQNTIAKSAIGRIGESLVLKLFLIGFLTIVLLIPSVWIQNIISERQGRQQEAIAEISDKWSGPQVLQGPVLVIPYNGTVMKHDTTGKAVASETVQNIYILPETLDISATTQPERRHRGIFEAVVYNARIHIAGKFSALELKKSAIDPAKVVWDKARVAIGMTDLKGLKNNPVIRLATMAYPVEPDFSGLALFPNCLVAQPDRGSIRSSDITFALSLDIRGSSELTFLHLGKKTVVTVDGAWTAPSFTGRYLPDHHSQTADAFRASWQIPYFNRPWPQQWVDGNTSVSQRAADGSFGVKFILPVDQYQKTMRTAKYGVLIILLAFVSLFFTELVSKRKVHLLQYLLIGASMTIYYTLLLSFSEQVGFNIAYLIASIATIALIVAFLAALFKDKGPALVFGGILTMFYGFIYVIIQLEDLALLFGSIGLFVIVAAIMYFSAKIEWYPQQTISDKETR